MDVRCNRCDTEYEFDDALISERGTTVKCTNCGFQFKIYPGKGGGLAPERWVVRTASGRELVYTSLRELQRGIAEKKVLASDLLSRGKQTPRPLGSIAELEPFFQVTNTSSARKSGSGERVQRTLHGVAPPQAEFRGYRGSQPPPPAQAAHSTPPPAAAPANGVATPIPPTVTSGTLEPPEVAPLAAPVSAPALGELQPTAAGSHSQSVAFSEPKPVSMAGEDASETSSSSARSASNPELQPHSAREIAKPRPPADSVPNSPRSLVGTPMSPLVARLDSMRDIPIPPAPVSSPRNLPPIEVANIRDSFKSYDELQLDHLPEDLHARLVRSRWIAGVVVVGVLGLFGATVGRRYIAQLIGTAVVSSSSDARVAKFLSQGARLADEGDFEGAKEEFDKAAALAEKDPAVLTALARLETLRADVSWLKLRIIDPASTDLVQATHRELGRRVGKAHAAVDRAFAVSPEDPAVLRARVDALRLNGEADKAREWLGPLSANASVPENAYVLAALDLADPAPIWPSVIDRLRTAAAAERDPGRARAALIYALARAGRLSEAEAEFSKIDGRAKPHPLLEELRAFLLRAKRSEGTPGEAPAKLNAVDTNKLPKLDTSPAAEDARPPGGDFRSRLAQASAALRQGELDRAARLYDSVLAEQPRNTEALSGLADVAKARHDPALAAKMYDRVLSENPNYWPAMLASADQKWDAGDKPGALLLYRRLVEQAGADSEYGARAAARIAQSEAAPARANAPVETGAPIKPPAPSKPGAPAAEPYIDRSDLPEGK
ncbi:MAG TPA: zinc-ribbon domain-containing protein [Polyangiaceae bacterium]|nr:zinc-ribbon domain-containing protein [Polyangiaceae bacterium]